MIFSEPKVEFVKIDLTGSIVTNASLCNGTETYPGGGVGCSNKYYATMGGDPDVNDCGQGYEDCTSFCS